jgi:hypothetical protein
MPAQISLGRLGGQLKLLYFALLLAVCLAPTQKKSVAETALKLPFATSLSSTSAMAANGKTKP